MTKRLFAIVLAAILAITMFTFPAAAAGVTATLTTRDDGNRLALTFTSGKSVPNCNKVVINYIMGNTTVKTVTLTSASDLAKTDNDYATSRGGEYFAQVIYYNGSVQLDSANSATVTVPTPVRRCQNEIFTLISRTLYNRISSTEVFKKPFS